MHLTGKLDARAVANYLLEKAQRDGVRIDNLMMQKIVYICHGWHLAVTGEPLFSQQVQAWPHGPVIPEVYRAFNRFGGGPITEPATFYDYDASTFRPYDGPMPDNTRQVVDRVWEQYKLYDGPQLVALTHKPGTPWHKVAGGKKREEIRDLPIDEGVIRDYYYQLGSQRSSVK